MTVDDKQKTWGRPFDVESFYDDKERALAKVDNAWAKAALFFRTGNHFGHQPGTLGRSTLIGIRDAIEVFKLRFEKGETLALLQAVELCADENVPLPTWLATAYCASLDSFLQPGPYASLDQIFHSPNLPTNTPKRAAAARQDWELGGLIWSATWEAATDDESITSLNAALKIALDKNKFGIKKSKANELFLMHDKNYTEHSKKPSFSQFLKIRQKQFHSK